MERDTLAASVCFGLFYVLDMFALWGGTMPFLPVGAQTDVLIDAFMYPSFSFECSFFAYALISLRRPGFVRRLLPGIAVVAYAVGVACLGWLSAGGGTVAAGLAGFFVGWGTASIFMLWQFVFESFGVAKACRSIVGAFLVAMAVYLLCSIAVPVGARYAIMVVFSAVVLVGAIVLYRRRGASGPAGEKRSVSGFFADYWRAVVCAAIVGCCAGAMRGAAILSAGDGELVNVMSMVLLGAAAVVFFIVWTKRSIAMSLTSVFRAFAPVLLVVFAMVPIVGDSSGAFVAGISYALLGCVNVILAIQALVAAKSRGLDVAFVYGVFAGFLWTLHDISYVTARAITHGVFSLAIPAYPSVVVFSLVALGFGLFISQGGAKSVLSPQQARIENIELIRTDAMPQQRGRSADEGSGTYDRVSEQVRVLSRKYFLTDREREVAELMVRGYTVKRIAEKLVVSENTVRSHTKSIYAKLDVHKKADLAALVASVRLDEKNQS